MLHKEFIAVSKMVGFSQLAVHPILRGAEGIILEQAEEEEDA
jgi:hypothetical protein